VLVIEKGSSECNVVRLLASLFGSEVYPSYTRCRTARSATIHENSTAKLHVAERYVA